MCLSLGGIVVLNRRETGSESEADAQIRTGDPFITSEVLYQLSYVGSRLSLAPALCRFRPGWRP